MRSVIWLSSATCRAPLTQPSVMNALLSCTGGDLNVAVGSGAGGGITTGSNIIAIGAGVSGVSTQFLARWMTAAISAIFTVPVDPGTAASCIRRCGRKVRHGGCRCQWEQNGGTTPQTLLNEFLKGQKRLAELEATVAQQAKAIGVLTSQLKEQAAQIQTRNRTN